MLSARQPLLVGAAQASSGILAVFQSNGSIELRRGSEIGPALATPPGSGPTIGLFDRSSRYLAGMRGGALHVWTLPTAPKAAQADGR